MGSRCRRMRIALALLAAMLAGFVPGGPGLAEEIEPPASETPAPRPASPALIPMTFALVTGAPGACGPGCSEWIAAEGAILPGTVVTFQAFLPQIGRRRPPIVIDSDGGIVDIAMALGRFVRRARLDTIVARTERAGEAPTLGLKGACHGACLYVLAAGITRSARPGAAISISPIDFRHVAGGDLPDALRHKMIQATLDRVRSYLGDMGIDPALGDLMDGETSQPFYPDWGTLEGYRLITRDGGD
jgi:hypothetical protein